MNGTFFKLYFKCSCLVYKAVMVVMFLTSCYVVNASSINVKQRVSHDVSLVKAFENKTTALMKSKRSDFVTIGADVACDYDSAVDSIQVAIDAGANEIRVASNGVYQNNLVIENQSVSIRGGYADCTAAENNQYDFSNFVEIDGSAVAEPVIQIIGTDFEQQIRLENLILKGGTSVFPKFGGGLSVFEASVDLQLLRVWLKQNSGSAGVGMYVKSTDGNLTTRVTARGVIINENHASGIGGGLYCYGEVDMVFSGMSVIVNNDANVAGGMFLRNGCKVSMYSEMFEDSISLFAGIYFNQSLSYAGGVYLLFNAELYLFGQRMCSESGCLGSNQIPIQVQGNVAGVSSRPNVNGGGIYMGSSSDVYLYANGLHMSENSARGHGGGVYMESNAEVVIERQKGACWKPDRCNLIINNTSGTEVGLGGAFYVDDGAELSIESTYFEENRADFGTAINATGENAVVTIQGSVFDDNGNDGNDDFSDFSVIRASLGASIEVSHSTFVDNNFQNQLFDIGVAEDSSLSLLNSIAYEPDSGNLFSPAKGTVVVDCLLAHEDSSYDGDNVLVADPEFVDRLAGDYHLKPQSSAIDLCSEVPLLSPIDIDDELRGWDDNQSANGFGFYDAGADESYLSDVIYENNFESVLAR